MRLLVASTLRYSAGRRSYVPSFIIQFIKDNYEAFGESTLYMFVEDLQRMVDMTPPTHFAERDQAIELIRRIKDE